MKLGDDLCRDVLRGGVNDLGGTLMEETISRMAGSANGSYKTITDLAAIVAPLGRELRQRTTTYGGVPPERAAAARASDGVCDAVRRKLPVVAGVPLAGCTTGAGLQARAAALCSAPAATSHVPPPLSAEWPMGAIDPPMAIAGELGR